MAYSKRCGDCEIQHMFYTDMGVRVICAGPCGKMFHAQCTEPYRKGNTLSADMVWLCKTCRANPSSGVQHRELALQTIIRDLIGKVESIDGNVQQLKQLLTPRAENVKSSTSDRTASQISSLAMTSEKDNGSDDLDVPSTFAEVKTATDPEIALECPVGDAPRKDVTKQKLPPKVLKLVFQHLSVAELKTARLVSKRWKKTVDNDASLLQKIKLKFSGDIDRDFNPKSMMPVSSVQFNEAHIFAVQSWWSALLGERLTHLTMTESCSVAMPTLLMMLQQVPNLTFLHLYCREALTYSAALEELPKIRLEKMDTFEVYLLPEQGRLLPLFGKMFPKLKNLNLSGEYECANVCKILQTTKDTLNSVSMTTSLSALQSVPKMQNLNKATITIHKIGNADSSLREQLPHDPYMQPSVQALDLYFNVQDDIYGRPSGYSETLVQLIKNFPDLQRLSFDYLEADVTILEKLDLKNLKYLQIRGKFGTDSYNYHFTHYQPLSFNRLTILQLSELRLHNINLESSGMRVFLEKATNLHTISLSECRLDSWSDLFGPIQSKRWRSLSLEHVKVNESNTNDGLYVYFDELRNLELVGCTMPKKMQLKLFRLCPRLEELYYSDGLNSIELDVILMIRQKMKLLRNLTLSAPGITDDIVECICNNGPKLERFLVTQLD